MSNKHISNGKAAVRTIKAAGEQGAKGYRLLGASANGWLAELAEDVSPKRKAREFAEIVGTSEGVVSKARAIAKAFPSDTAMVKACKDAQRPVTIDDAYQLARGGGSSNGGGAFDAVKVAAAFARSHKDMSKAEFESFVKEARKLFA